MMSAIVTDNLAKTYPNGVEAVKGINLNIQEGTVFGFLGPNGAGKSTTVAMLVGQLLPSAGSYMVLGNKPGNAIKSLVGFVPQQLVFYEKLTTFENLKLFASLQGVPNAATRIAELIQLLGMEEFRNQQAGTLSGGQARRLNVAIGLLPNPPVIVLDEPSAGMDPQSRNILWESIQQLADGRTTIILVTHLMEVADRLCDRIAIIDHGQVLIEGTPEELKRNLGDGDVAILHFSEDLETAKVDMLAEQLKTISSTIFRYNHTIQIQANGIASSLPDILKIQEQTGLVLKDLVIRSNTLEDVFLHQTGKQLRE